MTRSILKKQSGFTLIEMLVVVAIVGVVATISTQIILSLIRSNNKTTVQNEVKQNGTYVLDLVQRDIRAATGVSVSGTASSSSPVTLTLTNQDGTTSVYTCQLKSGTTSNGFIRRGGNDLLNTNINNGVAVTACNYIMVSNTNPQLINVTFTLTQAAASATRSDLTTSQSFETSVSLRNY